MRIATATLVGLTAIVLLTAVPVTSTLALDRDGFLAGLGMHTYLAG